MQVYLHGRDNIGWSIDIDRKHIELFLRDISLVITKNFIKADVIHSVWWNQLLAKRYYLLRLKKKIIATATNEIDLNNKDYLKAKKFVSLWIAPNGRQYETLKSDGVKVATISLDRFFESQRWPGWIASRLTLRVLRYKPSQGCGVS